MIKIRNFESVISGVFVIIINGTMLNYQHCLFAMKSST